MKEVVILVGLPGAGKSTYCQSVLAEHVRISQDEGPRTFPGVLHSLEQLVQAGVERIVIDRTNPLRHQRDLFAQVARTHGYRVRIIHFDVPRSLCEQRILARKDHPTLDASRMHQAFDRYEQCLDIPTPQECDNLVTIGADSLDRSPPSPPAGRQECQK